MGSEASREEEGKCGSMAAEQLTSSLQQVTMAWFWLLQDFSSLGMVHIVPVRATTS